MASGPSLFVPSTTCRTFFILPQVFFLRLLPFATLVGLYFSDLPCPSPTSWRASFHCFSVKLNFSCPLGLSPFVAPPYMFLVISFAFDAWYKLFSLFFLFSSGQGAPSLSPFLIRPSFSLGFLVTFAVPTEDRQLGGDAALARVHCSARPSMY